MVKTLSYQKWGKCGHFMPSVIHMALALAVELSAKVKTPVHKEHM